MSDTVRNKWRHVLAHLHTWKRGEERAPHKPLLALSLIARAAKGKSQDVHFAEIESQLERLLREFGPSRRSYHPELPFWHLQTDGIWKIKNAAALPPKKAGSSPSRSTLERNDAVGFVPDELWDVLKNDAALRDELATSLLESFWPETLHPALRQAIGLADAGEVTGGRTRVARDPQFREDVIRAYERCCAVCGYDGRLADIPLGLDAAHIRWRAYAGPDLVENGLALCSYHHVALDSGALGISRDHRILVSSDVSGIQMVRELLYRFSGRTPRLPQDAFPRPSEAFLDWHRHQVFHAPERKDTTNVIREPKLLAAEEETQYPLKL